METVSWDRLLTPIPVIDMACVDANIRKLQKICDAAGVANRPHIKTHKSVKIAEMQMKAGAVGIACQTLYEAEVMLDDGIDDILITHGMVGTAKAETLARLALRGRIGVIADSPEAVSDLAAASDRYDAPIDVLVECETGSNRSGIDNHEDILALAKCIQRTKKLNFAGIMLYPPLGPVEQTRSFVTHLEDKFSKAGQTLGTISNGGTPNLEQIGFCGETEYRSGTSVYNDRMMHGLGVCSLDDCALHVYATVVSTPSKDRIILDAGSKSLTSDLVGFNSFGILHDYPDAIIERLNEEHGVVDVSACSTPPKIGDVVKILPNHVCPVSNLFDIVLVRELDGRLHWMTVDARGFGESVAH